MKLRQKIVSLFVAVATAASLMTVSASATDPVGTNPTVLTDGVQATEQVPYDDSKNYDNGHNYVDFKFTAPADGIMLLTIDFASNNSSINVYRADNSKEIGCAKSDNATGKYDSYYGYLWDETAGLYAGTLSYKVEKGDYIIRVSRYFRGGSNGTKGNGRVHITAEMQKPDAPSSIKVSAKTENSITLTWAEPEGVDSYDVRYRPSTSTTWKTVSDIKDNTVTIKSLTAATKYYFSIRSKAGEIDGNWSTTSSVTTTDPKNVTIAKPTISTSKLVVNVTWKAVANATGYNFKYSTDNKTWKTVSVTGTTYAMPVTAGKTYYYAVQGKNSVKTGTWSATKTIKIG